MEGIRDRFTRCIFQSLRQLRRIIRSAQLFAGWPENPALRSANRKSVPQANFYHNIYPPYHNPYSPITTLFSLPQPLPPLPHHLPAYRSSYPPYHNSYPFTSTPTPLPKPLPPYQNRYPLNTTLTSPFPPLLRCLNVAPPLFTASLSFS